MKKFLNGMLFGLLISFGTISYASNTIQAVIFPSIFNFNGESKSVDEGYEVLNYKDHVYVPIRFVAENMNATVGYSARNHNISILSAGGGKQSS